MQSHLKYADVSQMWVCVWGSKFSVVSWGFAACARPFLNKRKQTDTLSSSSLLATSISPFSSRPSTVFMFSSFSRTLGRKQFLYKGHSVNYAYVSFIDRGTSLTSWCIQNMFQFSHTPLLELVQSQLGGSLHGESQRQIDREGVSNSRTSKHTGLFQIWKNSKGSVANLIRNLCLQILNLCLQWHVVIVQGLQRRRQETGKRRQHLLCQDNTGSDSILNNDIVLIIPSRVYKTIRWMISIWQNACKCEPTCPLYGRAVYMVFNSIFPLNTMRGLEHCLPNSCRLMNQCNVGIRIFRWSALVTIPAC